MNFQESYLSFKVGGEKFALPLAEVREVVPARDLASVPFTPGFVEGILNLRGRIVTVLNLCTRFELKQIEGNTEESILIVERNGALLGLKIDGIENVIQLSQDELTDPPDFGGTPVSHFMTALIRKERQFIVVLGIEKLFSFEEISSSVVGMRSTAVA